MTVTTKGKSALIRPWKSQDGHIKFWSGCLCWQSEPMMKKLSEVMRYA